MIIAVASFACLFVGASLLLAQIRFFQRTSLVQRLAPYQPASTNAAPRSERRAVSALFLPMVEALGNRLSSVIGMKDEPSLRLARAGRSETPAHFRVRQFTRATAAFIGAVALVIFVGPPLVIALAVIFGIPALVALLSEQQLDSETKTRGAAITAELPVVAEHLGILLGAGYSLPSALTRLSERSSGVVGMDLQGVVRRIRQGNSEISSLSTWAELVQVDSVDRLVAVLALHQEASDLGALISEEAKAIRAEAHRAVLESIERRAQLVWIPVTVATLVPGLILLAVPFIAAMSQVTGT